MSLGNARWIMPSRKVIGEDPLLEGSRASEFSAANCDHMC